MKLVAYKKVLSKVGLKDIITRVLTSSQRQQITCASIMSSVPDNRGVAGQKPN